MVSLTDIDGISPFSERAEIYARSRPSYPAALIARIVGDAAAPRVIDLGAGTAIATRLLASEAGCALAVDPSFEMLLAAAGIARVQSRAEVLPFRSHCADILTAFNAFHWFEPDATFEEARRVLKRGGRLALVWNDWDHRDRFTSAFVRLMRSQEGDHPPEDREVEVAPLYRTKYFEDVQRVEFPNAHRLDLTLLRLRLQSVSYIPRSGEGWEALSRELDALFEHFASPEGFVTHRYTTSAFIARVVA